jgi:HEAT repeat protein
VKSYAAAALGGIGEPAIDPLIRVLLGSERAVRGEAARALCAIGARTIPHLKNALEQASPEEQRILEMMLMRVDESGIRAVLELQGIDPERRRDACSRIDERAE